MTFEPMPKIPRLFRDIVITEKIDGTNACVIVPVDPHMPVQAGSKKRLLVRGQQTDNFGFAAWVEEHENELRNLGPGVHRGEWWGKGIQRQYGQAEKHFSLFNVTKWGEVTQRPACCDVVPVLYEGPFGTLIINLVLAELSRTGSVAVPGFMQPEGIVVWHSASHHLFKVTLEDDEKHKGEEGGN